MGTLNFVNLIQAGICTVGVLGAILLFKCKSAQYRGIAYLLLLTAFASCINILEESGLSRDIYLISPIFIMLFGPATYLAVKQFVDKQLAKSQLWHLLPVLPVVFFTSYIEIVIGIGTIWRIAYALLTVVLILQHKRLLDEQRSDSDDFSLNWLIWIIAITACFNLVDLLRLNFQYAIPYHINVLGQGINNAVWLLAAMLIIIKLQIQDYTPLTQKMDSGNTTSNTNSTKNTPANKSDRPEHDTDFASIFIELDNLVSTKQWYLKPRLTLLDMNELTGLQTRDISRAINLGAQKSFNEYINAYRVEFVCQLLKNRTTKPLIDVALDAGFSSKAAFNKVFKQVVGLTPSQYKHSIKANI